ncbi:MAG: hypothetical protein UU31_C0010G0001, partial [Candidatus Uhrbacteria bacterium GW2011_GWA2_41_10]
MIIFSFISIMGSPIQTLALSPPNIVSYQGRLLNNNSVPVTVATTDIEFRFFDMEAGGTCLWSNSSSTCDGNTPGSTIARTVTLTDGLFTENLGDTSIGTPYAAISDSLFADNNEVYLEIEVEGETLSPRKQMMATPFALNSQSLDGLDSAVFLRSDGNDTATGAYDFTSTTFTGSSPISFEGSADDGFETTFVMTNPTTDQTITFQNGSGTVAFLSDIASGASLWEAGVNGTLENDVAVIIGADAAFSHGSGGIGDLRVADELEVIGNSFFDGTLDANGQIDFGDGGDTVAINSSDWDISTTGDMTGIGAITMDSDIAVNGDDITSDGNLSLSATGYTRIGDTGIPGSATTDDSLYVEGPLEVDNTVYFDAGLNVIGTASFNGSVDINSDLSIADTNISFDGATTTFTTTGAFTLTPGGAVILGDGGDTMSINTSDWDIGTTGDMSGIGTFGSDGIATFAANVNANG